MVYSRERHHLSNTVTVTNSDSQLAFSTSMQMQQNVKGRSSMECNAEDWAMANSTDFAKWASLVYSHNPKVWRYQNKSCDGL